jgi:hypothetical protein
MENNYEYQGSLRLSPEYSNPSFTFTDGTTNEPIMVIKKGKFIWKGEEVEDVYNIYERFNEWMKNQKK